MSTMTAPIPPRAACSGAPNRAPSRPPASSNGSSESPPGLPWPMCSRPTIDAHTSARPMPRRRSRRVSACVAALDDDAARGDEEHERDDHPAGAEHERRGRVEAVAERAGQVRVDPERGDEGEDEQPDGEGVVGVPAELAGQLLAPLRRGAPPRRCPLLGRRPPRARRAGPALRATRRGRSAPARGCHRGTTVTPATCTTTVCSASQLEELRMPHPVGSPSARRLRRGAIRSSAESRLPLWRAAAADRAAAPPIYSAET